MKARRSPGDGFTLIELLVVMAVIGLLAALAFPALKAMGNARDQSVCISNMRQIGSAFMLFAGDNSYMLPGRVTTASGGDKWPGALAKYLGDTRVYAASFDPLNYIIRNVDPLSNTGNNTSYIMNGYNDQGTMTDAAASIRLNSFATTTNTILLGVPKNNGNAHNTQYYMDLLEPPNGNQYDVLNLAAFNSGSVYLFADGSARFITQAAYIAPDPQNPSQRYGDDLWLIDKTYQIPKVGKGGQ